MRSMTTEPLARIYHYNVTRLVGGIGNRYDVCDLLTNALRRLQSARPGLLSTLSSHDWHYAHPIQPLVARAR